MSLMVDLQDAEEAMCDAGLSLLAEAVVREITDLREEVRRLEAARPRDGVKEDDSA